MELIKEKEKTCWTCNDTFSWWQWMGKIGLLMRYTRGYFSRSWVRVCKIGFDIWKLNLGWALQDHVFCGNKNEPNIYASSQPRHYIRQACTGWFSLIFFNPQNFPMAVPALHTGGEIEAQTDDVSFVRSPMCMWQSGSSNLMLSTHLLFSCFRHC